MGFRRNLSVPRVGLVRSWVILALVASWVPGLDSSAAAEDVSRGRLLFSIHCSSCHGPKAAGDGPLADAFKEKIPDLRLIVAENDGVFPTSEIRRCIDGTEVVGAHGDREMPVWGLGFGSGERATSPEEVRAALDAILGWLKTVQITGEEPSVSPD